MDKTHSIISLRYIFRLLLRPRLGFVELAAIDVSASAVFFRLALWLGLIPPIFAYLGASKFGWRLGTSEPIFLSASNLLAVSAAYYFALLFGFVSTGFVSRWMAKTYGARESLGAHFALITVVGAPLVVGSVIHLYPDVFINFLFLVPVVMWSMYLLYHGIAVVMHTSAEQGMLMASSLLGYLFVAAVSLLGITVVLWGHGFGPALGI